MPVLADLETTLSQAVAAAHSAQAELDAARKKLGLDPQPKKFYLRNEVVAEISAALAAKPKKPLSFYEQQKLEREQQQAQPVVHSARLAFETLDNVFKFYLDNDVSTKDLRVVLVGMRHNLDPSYPMDTSDPTQMASWVTVLRSAAADTPRPRLDPAAATAADIARAAAIARGEVVPLPSSAAAQAIVAAGRRRRNEKDPTT
jgi:hypothetical protein